MVLESQGEYDSQWAAICSIAPKTGCTPETLRVWVRQYERDTGGGDGGLTSTTFVLDALEQALWARRPSGTVHHSDKGSQYVSLAYTQRLKEAGLLASTGSTGDSYDNAMAESINGLYKAEVIHRKSWNSALRPHEYNGGLPPNESENRYWKNSNAVASFC